MSKTDYGEEILWCLVEADGQEVAKRHIGRKLTKEELESVKKGLTFGFEFWEDVMKAAIDEATDYEKLGQEAKEARIKATEKT